MTALPSAPPIHPQVLIPRPTAPPNVLGWAGIAGVAAAVAVPLDRPGIGWALGGLAMAAVVVADRQRARAEVPSISRSLWVLAALGLLAVGAVRASEWLFVLCALTACAAGSLAVANGRSLLAVLAVPFGALRAMPWVARGLAALHNRVGASSLRLIGSVAVAVLLAVVFGALFASADAAFASLVDAVVPRLDGGSMTRWLFVFAAAAVITAGACHLLADPPDLDGVARRPKPVRRVEWVLPVGVLVVLFAVFVLVQLAVLFGGREYVLRTSGLTAAEYARRGFWQLCVITVLALLVIRLTARRAPADSRADRMWLRVLLGGLAGLTLVIVVSALSRMWAYQEAFGYTVLRVLVGACELWLGVVCLMVLVAILRLRARWLPRAVIASGVLALLLLAVLNPDAYVAGRNVARYEQTGKIDVDYLSTLSVDAVPELARLPEPARSCALSAMRARLDARAARTAGRAGTWAGRRPGIACAARISVPVREPDRLLPRV